MSVCWVNDCELLSERQAKRNSWIRVLSQLASPPWCSLFMFLNCRSIKSQEMRLLLRSFICPVNLCSWYFIRAKLFKSIKSLAACLKAENTIKDIINSEALPYLQDKLRLSVLVSESASKTSGITPWNDSRPWSVTSSEIWNKLSQTQASLIRIPAG